MAVLTRPSTEGALPPDDGPGSSASPGGDARRQPRRPELAPFDPIRAFGQTLVWLGVLTLSFAVFQLWGTGLLEWRAQRALAAEFEQLVGESNGTGSLAGLDTAAAAGGSGEPNQPNVSGDVPAEWPRPQNTEPALYPASPESGLLPPDGAAIGRIRIPAIGIEKTIVQGVTRPALREGPGRYPTTPLPGQRGNASIAGHRTTHGAPFIDLDRLQPGDFIDVETLDGEFRYEVMGHERANGSIEGHIIVDPSDVSVIGDHGDDRLTLTACHPKYSARERIVVTALLIGAPSAAPVIVASTPTVDASFDTFDPTITLEGDGAEGVGSGAGIDVDEASTIGVDDALLDESLGWRTNEIEPTVLWATITVLAFHAIWIVGRLWRRRLSYGLLSPVAITLLFVTFTHLDRLLPAF